MPRGIPAGQAYFTLLLNDQLTKGLAGVSNRLKQGLDRLRSSPLAALNALRIGVQGVTAAIVAAGAAIVAVGRKFATFGDRFDKLATRTDISAEALQELSYAAQITGTNIDQLGQALFRARRRIGNAAMGTGPAVRAFKQLRINAKALSRLKPEEQFEELVKALSNVANEAQRNQLAFEIFGDNFRQIQPLIDQGVEGIQALRAEARRMGILSNADVRRAAELNDTFFRLTRSAEMLAVSLGNAFSPALLEIMEGMAAQINKMAVGMLAFGRIANTVWAKFKLEGFEALEAVFRPLADIYGAITGERPDWMGEEFDLARGELERGVGRALIGDVGNYFEQGGVLATRREAPIPPGPYASSQLMGSFAGQFIGVARAQDPKKEEKEMVDLLEQINGKDFVVLGGDGG